MKRLLVAPALLLASVLAAAVAVGDGPIDRLMGRADKAAAASPAAGSPAASPAVSPGTPAAPGTPGVSATPGAPASLWRPGTPQWGVNVHWTDDLDDSDTVVRLKARRTAAYLVGLRANSVSFNLPFFTGYRDSTRLWADARRTPSPARLGIAVEEAVAAGLRVTVRPLMDEESLVPPKGWRGGIQPSDRDAWFASYRNFLAPYLDVSRARGAATFVVGTELNSLEGDPRWVSLVRWAKERFRGEIAYAANWDNWTTKPIAVDVDRLGLDAYFPLRNLTASATPADIARGWRTYLDRPASKAQKGTLLYEVGATAQDGAYSAPGDWYTRRRLNEALQATWFRGVCQVVTERRMAGVYWWAYDFHTDPAAVDREKVPRLEFAGRPATEAAIRECFSNTFEVAPERR